MLCFAFGLVAEIERNLISMRTQEALALRRERGIVLGRRKGSFTKLQLLIENGPQIVRALNSGKTIAGICRDYGVARDTFNRFRIKYMYSIERGNFIRYRFNGNAYKAYRLHETEAAKTCPGT